MSKFKFFVIIVCLAALTGCCSDKSNFKDYTPWWVNGTNSVSR